MHKVRTHAQTRRPFSQTVLANLPTRAHSDTRGELLPDPAHDAVEFVVYVVRDDARRAQGLADITVRGLAGLASVVAMVT